MVTKTGIKLMTNKAFELRLVHAKTFAAEQIEDRFECSVVAVHHVTTLVEPSNEHSAAAFRFDVELSTGNTLPCVYTEGGRDGGRKLYTELS